MLDLVIRNGKVVLEDAIIEADIGILDGRIGRIGKRLSGEEDLDARGCVIMPGLIDSHVHFREPGFTHKEDWLTGSSAGAAGGVTTVLDMPNTNPATTSRDALAEKRSIAQKRSILDYGFHFGSAQNNTEEIRKVGGIASVKFYLGSSTGNMLVEDDLTIFEQFNILSKKKITATVHAENEFLIKKETERLKAEGRTDPDAYSEARPSEAAISAVEKAIKISATAKNRLHICHISTKGEIDLIKKKKKSGLSCEATPHHLFLTTEDYKSLGNLGKMNPPLRTKKDAAALWKGMNNGVIDLIASDHAPHLLEEKEGSIWTAASGVPGIETMLPLLLNEANKKRISLNRIAHLTSGNPAKIFGIKNKGRIKKGFDADLVVIDMKKEKRIDASKLFTKCRWSPFEGRKIKGWPTKTFVRGNLVFDEGNIYKNKGTEVTYGIH